MPRLLGKRLNTSTNHSPNTLCELDEIFLNLNNLKILSSNDSNKPTKFTKKKGLMKH